MKQPAPGWVTVVAQDARWSALVVVICCLLAWGPTVHGGVVDYDTPWLVVDNPLLRDGDPAVIPTLLWDLSLGTRMTLGAEFLPVRDLSVLLDFALFGDSWWAHHAHNLWWYTVGCVAFLFVMREILGRGLPALLAATLYATHPVHLECVAWLASRKDVLGLAFFWTALLVGIRGGRGAWWSAGLALVAIWSKNLTITLPVVLFFTVLLLFRERWRGRWVVATVLHGAVLATTLSLSLRLGEVVQMTVPSRASGALELVVLQGRMLLHYAGSLLWPAGLSPTYPEPQLHPLEQLENIVGVAIYALLLAAVPLLWWRKRPRAALGVVWGFVMLAPVFQLVPLQNLVADRYLMLPLGGVVLALASALPRHRLTAAAAAGATVVFTLSSAVLAPMWHSSEALWGTAAQRYPDHVPALLRHAGAVAATDSRAALELYTAALVQHPDDPRLWTGRGSAELALGDPAAAERSWRQALARKPDHRKALNNLAALLTRRGAPPEAVALGQQLTRSYPTYAEGWDTLSAAQIAAGDGSGAAASAERALALTPYSATSWCNRGTAAFLLEDWPVAARAWQRCAALSPDNPYPRKGLSELERRGLLPR
jgi:Flp pilus assembly protein TadD